MDFETLKIFLSLIFEFIDKNSGEFIAALAGAFSGAACATWLERSKEKRKKADEEHGAIVGAQMALVAQSNTLRNIQKQFLDPLREDAQRDQKIIQMRMTGTSLRVSYDKIAFLLNKKKADLVLEIHAAEQSYISAIEALEWRNEAYERLHRNSELEEMDPKSGHCKIAVKDIRDVKLLKDLTNALYTHVDKAHERVSLQIKELFKAGKEIFPEREFLKIVGEK